MKNGTDILIIDDEELILKAIEKIAEFQKLTTHICLNVNEALIKLESNQYKLIISDIMMPGKDGFDFLKFINQKRITTPVLITSGYSTIENAVKALYEGAFGFIPKPFTFDELSGLIKKGITYNTILGKKFKTDSEQQSLLSHVSCPSKYYRLGYDTWMNQTGEGIINIGVTDLFIKSIGIIEELEFLKTDESIFQGEVCVKIIDNDKCTHQLLAPVSGKIIDINQKIIDDKSLLEKDPYFLGWIYKMIPSNLEHDLNNIIPCSSD